MKCPHCGVNFHDNPNHVDLGEDVDGNWVISTQTCSSCNRFVVYLLKATPTYVIGGSRVVHGVTNVDENSVTMVRPRVSYRPCPPEVPQEIAKDFLAAHLICDDSPEASAAMSRRCLQNILRDQNAANAQQRDLAEQIQQILNSNTLPTYIARDIDAIRNVGNFAAHPMKSKATGQILPVEPGEANWNLDVIEELFEFYYVKPTLSQKNRNALNAKLQSAGKPPMK